MKAKQDSILQIPGKKSLKGGGKGAEKMIEADGYR